jgi:hypothetical protein
MPLRTLLLVLAVAPAFLSSCFDGGRSPVPTAPLVLTAGVEELAESNASRVVDEESLRRVGLGGARPRPGRSYTFTTPRGEPFHFEVRSLVEGNAGWVVVGVAHVLDGSQLPGDRASSLVEAGIVVQGPGMFIDGNQLQWVQAGGDGFGHITVRGVIDRSQTIAVEAQTEQGVVTALVHLDIGPRSIINSTVDVRADHPNIVRDDLLYSSDSWQFGLPTLAVSGDRASIVVYEGDRGEPVSPVRYELRMQQDMQTGVVTGGGEGLLTSDTGNWRDHEIAALYNVLAVARSTGSGVKLRMSYDRGAGFAQEFSFDHVSGAWGTRLVQVAMAANYQLALVYWRTVDELGGAHSELVLVEGEPATFDQNGSPTAFVFTPPRVVFAAERTATPLPMGVAWSAGGDLVIGYGYSYLSFAGIETRFECAIRPWQGDFTLHVVDEERMMGWDPSVAVLGQGAGLQVYYAYEAQDGIRIKQLDIHGPTSAWPIVTGGPGSYAPAIFARDVQGAAQVDVVYLALHAAGHELRSTRWDVFGGAPPRDHVLSRATVTPVLPSGARYRQVGFFGFDAVRSGDEILVVYDEEQFDAQQLIWMAPVVGGSTTLSGPILPPNFSTAQPPPLAVGMTEPLPPANPEHRHQLRLLVLR